MRYYVLDGAKCDEALDETLKYAPKYLSLYKGRSEENLASVAPYIVETNEIFEKWIIENGWGESWGYFIECDLPFEALYGHLRKFLIVETEAFKPLYFRFYDPRVIRLFLPTCTTVQLQTFLGPLELIICEVITDKSKLEGFSFNGGKLISSYYNLNEYFTINTNNPVQNKAPFDSIKEERKDNILQEPEIGESFNTGEASKKKRRFIY